MPPIALSLLTLVAAYLLGSLSGGLLLGGRRGVDIRTLGSGSAGGTNAFRTQGARFGVLVALFDLAKGALAAWCALRLVPFVPGYPSPAAHAYAAAFAAAVGHVWPLWHGFRGGKGAATLAGGVLVLWPWVAPVVVLAWMATIVFSGYVGAATVVAGLCLAAAALVSGAEPARLAYCLGAAALLLFTHRGNLARLLRGEESRFERARLLHRVWRRGG